MARRPGCRQPRQPLQQLPQQTFRRLQRTTEDAFAASQWGDSVDYVEDDAKRILVKGENIALTLFTCEGKQTQHDDPGVRLETEIDKQVKELVFWF